MTAIDASYAYCRRIARSRAKNFYYSFVLLSKPQKNAMCAMYAFMRFCDDLSDEPGAKAASVERWRGELAEALNGRYSDHPVWPGFHDAVQRYAIPQSYFFDMIDGVLSDFGLRHIETFAQLYDYCYKVASVAGLATIHIFGFCDRQALILAEKCGIAFQLTNILRDVREDAENGRVYLPADDLASFGVTSAEFLTTVPSAAFRSLMTFEVDRARAYYNESRPLLSLVDRRSRSSLWALITIYSRLLDRIRACNFDVLSQRVSLTGFEKSWIVLRALAR